MATSQSLESSPGSGRGPFAASPRNASRGFGCRSRSSCRASSCGPIGPRLTSSSAFGIRVPIIRTAIWSLPLAAWFLWRRRATFPWSLLAPSWAGLSLIALAAVARMVAARFYFPEFDGCSLPLWLAGACWLFGGWALLRWAAPSLGFLLFLVPLPATIETLLSQPLQATATTMSTWTLQCLGQPAIAEGTTILLNDNVLEVERACSGLRMFYGILALVGRVHHREPCETARRSRCCCWRRGTGGHCRQRHADHADGTDLRLRLGRGGPASFRTTWPGC